MTNQRDPILPAAYEGLRTPRLRWNFETGCHR